MAYKYRNLKTKEVVVTSNRVSGKNWEPADDPIEETPDEEIAAEEEAAEKPKTSRRGKK